MTKKLLSIFTQDSKAAVFKFEKEDEIVRPVECWASNPNDSDTLAACKRMSEDFERGDYAALNGLFQDENKCWKNPLKKRIGNSSIKAPLWLLEREGEISLKASISELGGGGCRLDTSAFEEWPKIQAEIRSTEGLSARSLAFLQGLSELIDPADKTSRPLWDVDIPTICGMDIINQINAFAGDPRGGTTMY